MRAPMKPVDQIGTKAHEASNSLKASRFSESDGDAMVAEAEVS
jgi:hypothetical protein